MKHLLRATLSLFCLSLPAYAADDCDCPTLSCDPCMVQQGREFYTEKCGKEGAKVRSCTRPTCVLRAEPTAACPKLPNPSVLPQPTALPQLPAVEAKAEPEVDVVGQVKVLQGSATITSATGEKTLLQQSASGDIHEKDRIETQIASLAIVNFKGGNRVHVHPQTTFEVQEFKDVDLSATRRTLLNLVRGKIRNQVEQKYNGSTSYYRIQTKEAVAGVRGTDFVAEEVEAVPGVGAQMRIETLKGIVNLSSLNETQSVDVHPGEGVKFANGVLGDIYKLTDEQIHNLELASRVDISRMPKSEPEVIDSPICAKPSGKFNQCMWRCVGSLPGDSRCHTDRAGVRCLRSRCNANGQWADPTQALEGNACPRTGEIVKDCDY